MARPKGGRLTVEEAHESLRKYGDNRTPAHVRKAYVALGDDTTFSRFVKVKDVERAHGKPRQLVMDARHPAFMEGRSIFYRKGVKQLSELKNLLVSGHSNVKIGNDVRDGMFLGYRIFTLALEERATCPRSCQHWTSCYGNHMPYARRVGVTPENRFEFEQRLAMEVTTLLNKRGWPGILVRLHALGDFFDTDYVNFWLHLLGKHPQLAVFGYTARRPDDPIGAVIAEGKELYGRRFAIRWSDGGFERDSTASILTADQCPPRTFICPEQTGKRDGCGKCGACWSSETNVAFLTH